MPNDSSAPKSARPIPVIVGATGAGKTAAALRLAKISNADVISADSRQVYQDVSVGTAKPAGRWTEDARHPLKKIYKTDGVVCHLVDILGPEAIFSAGDFAKRAEAILQALENAGRPAVIAGGTGLYLRALIDGLAPLPPKDENLRRELTARAEKSGRPALHAELARVDPAAAQAIPPNNIARLIRALEVHRLTGIPISRWQKDHTRPSPRPFRWFGLRWPKAAYETHLQGRCRAMLKSGMIEETEALLKKNVAPDAAVFQSLGYRDVILHIQGKLAREDLEKNLYAQTRLYAKRQMTWFRANPRIQWIDVDGATDMARAAQQLSATLRPISL